MTRQLIGLATFAAGAMLALPAHGQNYVTNGTFSNGLTGWNVYTQDGTAGGAPFGPAPQATTFNVTGSGAQTAAMLHVGDSDGPFNTTYGGGGLLQTLVTPSGTFSFMADYAVYNPAAFQNISAGFFSIIIDGVELASNNITTINSMQTLRGSFSFNTTLTAGNHTLRLQALRNALATADTPNQYFTNVSLSGNATAVPEPASWALMIAGFGLTGGAMRRRQRMTVRCA